MFQQSPNKIEWSYPEYSSPKAYIIALEFTKDGKPFHMQPRQDFNLVSQAKGLELLVKYSITKQPNWLLEAMIKYHFLPSAVYFYKHYIDECNKTFNCCLTDSSVSEVIEIMQKVAAVNWAPGYVLLALTNLYSGVYFYNKKQNLQATNCLKTCISALNIAIFFNENEKSKEFSKIATLNAFFAENVPHDYLFGCKNLYDALTSLEKFCTGLNNIHITTGDFASIRNMAKYFVATKLQKLPEPEKEEPQLECGHNYRKIL